VVDNRLVFNKQTACDAIRLILLAGFLLVIYKMGLFDFLGGSGYRDYGQGAIAPVPTPNPPQNVSYTPQVAAGSIQQYAGPAFGPQYKPPSPNVLGVSSSITSGKVNNPPPSKPPSQSPNNNSSLIDRYRQSGWSDMNAILKDIEAGGGSKFNTPSGPSPEELYAQQMRGEIEGGYNNYFSELDRIMNQGLANQQTAQQGIINNQYTTGVSALQNQETQGLADLGAESVAAEKNQAKNLRDLSDNLRNMFMAGNVFLGSRGAGDSSAANQYSYALNKLGTQQRSNVMSQTADIMAEIGRRTTALKDTFATEVQKLATIRDNKILELSNWFNEQQNNLRSMKAQGSLSKATDLANLSKQLLNNAISRLSTIDQETANKRLMLDQWAMNNAKTIDSLKANLGAVAGYKAAMPGVNQINGTPTVDASGNYSMPFFYGNSSEDRLKKIP
jgi:hypothetical protein